MNVPLRAWYSRSKSALLLPFGCDREEGVGAGEAWAEVEGLEGGGGARDGKSAGVGGVRLVLAPSVWRN